jgi:hypothetical protein
MRDYLWVVEEKWYGNKGWIGFRDRVFYKRENAREAQRKLRKQGDEETRIRRYVRFGS